MKIKNPVFIKSAAAKDGFYITPKPLVAVAGKSNVGKSSLINMLANNRKLARTSVTPGRTRLINYFDFGDFVLADLPGYGFARVSKDEKLAWARLTDSFFAEHKITLLLSLIDIRHPPTEDDKTLVNYLYHYAVPFTLIATKADKLPKTRVKPAIAALAAELKVGVGNVMAASAVTGAGREEILAEIERMIAAE